MLLTVWYYRIHSQHDYMEIVRKLKEKSGKTNAKTRALI